MPPQTQQGRRSSSGVAGIDIITPSTRHDDTVKRMVLRRFRRTMRRLFGGRWKQMSDGEVKELEKQIAAEMRTGTFRAVEPAIQPPTADELWQRQDDGGGGGAAAADRLPTMSSTTKRSTVVSQASRGQYYDEYGDDYGGYQDAHSVAGWGGAASSDSGYGPGYYDRVPPRQPAKAPEYYVPGGGPFDIPEARPESVYDGGSRANSMRSTITTRTSRRPPTQGYYPPNSSSYGESRAYSMRSDPGRIYARSPMPRMSLRSQPSWDGRYHGGGGDRSYSYGPGDRGYGYGGDYGYRGWDGQDIEEHEYPSQEPGTHYQDYQYPER
ncbi:hypothetical protein INS49_000713 [Diaporthe citri]|uniref:uncharacterized protein n=1 Tax=Diaporthe citri TaxID=83186 RepID=UPI001C7F41EF|nr:uncharacterized protein INS49_000713 [Diaporthe citri]KAG6366536.1 hypothetical protein INS49_000713 [Diaporthe citri]